MYFSLTQWGCNKIPSALTRPQCVMGTGASIGYLLPSNKQSRHQCWGELSVWTDLKLQCSQEPGQLIVERANVKHFILTMFILWNIGPESQRTPCSCLWCVCARLCGFVCVYYLLYWKMVDISMIETDFIVLEMYYLLAFLCLLWCCKRCAQYIFRLMGIGSAQKFIIRKSVLFCLKF